MQGEGCVFLFLHVSVAPAKLLEPPAHAQRTLSDVKIAATGMEGTTEMRAVEQPLHEQACHRPTVPENYGYISEWQYEHLGKRNRKLPTSANQPSEKESIASTISLSCKNSLQSTCNPQGQIVIWVGSKHSCGPHDGMDPVALNPADVTSVRVVETTVWLYELVTSAEIEGRLRLATEQAKLNTASRWERVSLNGWQ